jgi:hypothetical protein
MIRQIVLTAVLLSLVFVCASDAAKPSAATANQAPSPEARRSDPVYAYIDSARADLSDGKAHLINQIMKLSTEESAKFWPIYNEYEDELFDLGDQRVEMTRRFVKAQAQQSLDDASATALADDWFRIESQRLELVKKYHKRIAAELSPVRAAQFTQIEHRVGTVVDLLVASNLPLIRSAPRQ